MWADGRLYQGSYKCGQRDGEGYVFLTLHCNMFSACIRLTLGSHLVFRLMTWPYGARYRGQYKHDKRNGTCRKFINFPNAKLCMSLFLGNSHPPLSLQAPVSTLIPMAEHIVANTRMNDRMVSERRWRPTEVSFLRENGRWESS